jgi:type VI secretion system protein ImpK
VLDREGGTRRRDEPTDLHWDDDLDDLDQPVDADDGGAERAGGGRGLFDEEPPERGGELDWAAAEADEEERPDRGRIEWEEWSGPRRAERRRERPAAPPRRLTLMDLATPLFGCAAILPRSGDEPQPAYETVREEVLGLLRRLEDEAPSHGIEGEDAREAAYALSLFMDEQVAESSWEHRARWMSEPLHAVLHRDPEAGVNFFRRLDGLAERQGAVKEVYLVCLALGYRGQYVSMDPTRAAAELGQIRQKLLRDVHPVSMDRQRRLFPEAYAEARPLADRVAPPPRWWTGASLGALAVALLVFVLLLLFAGGVGEKQQEALARLEPAEGAAAAPELLRPAPDDGPPAAAEAPTEPAGTEAP